MNFAELKSRISYHTLLLGSVGLFASAVLATADLGTHADIAAAEQRDLENSLRQVLPDGFADNNLLADTLTLNRDDGSTVKLYVARKAGKVQGAVFEVSSRGYAGPVNALMGVTTEGKILGVRVIKHAETPGLGDKIELAKSSWILDFNGRAIGDPPIERWGVKKDGGIFDQFAGATITPRAVVKAVREGLVFFNAHLKEIQSAGSQHE